MAQGEITTSITVQFGNLDGSGQNGVLKLEVDTRKPGDGGLNADTNFVPGDSVYLHLHKTSNVTNLETIISAGSIVSAGEDSFEREETLVFFGEKEASIAYPAADGIVTKWIGANLGQPVLHNETVVRVPNPNLKVGVLKVTYTVRPKIYRLTSPISVSGELAFTIAILQKGIGQPWSLS